MPKRLLRIFGIKIEAEIREEVERSRSLSRGGAAHPHVVPHEERKDD